MPPAITEEEFGYELLLPPDNFALVCSGVYRSAFPKKKNFAFLKKLGIRTILCVIAFAAVCRDAHRANRTLILEEYPEQNIKFLEENNIKFLQFGVPGNKVRLSSL